MKRKQDDFTEPEAKRQGSSVAAHYNALSRDMTHRSGSRILQLRNFNNWIKASLIQRYTRPGDSVFDLGCGKGGDLNKWQIANISSLVGVDIAEVSVTQARERFQNLRNNTFTAQFHHVDCFSVPLVERIPDIPMYDVVSSQFVIHYSFESEAKVRMMLRNVTERLRSGGVFFGTTPNAYWIVKKLRNTPGLSFGNDIYRISFDQKNSYRAFGCRYVFKLEDAIHDVPEYLVHFPTLVRLAREYGLELIFKQQFHQMYLESLKDEESKRLLYRMNVMNARGEIAFDEWEAIGVYLAFAFRKQ